ncbi:MAG: hypothetical protein ACLSXO_03880 [Coprococcus sp.]
MEGTEQEPQQRWKDMTSEEETGTLRNTLETGKIHWICTADEPEVLIYVVIDEPNTESQEDSSLVLNLARSIMEEAFPYMNISTIDGQPVVAPEQPEKIEGRTTGGE